MPESSTVGPSASWRRSTKPPSSGSSSAASTAGSTSPAPINGAIDAKHTIAVPAPTRGTSASMSLAVPTRSTAKTFSQSAIVGEMPAACATARSVPSSDTRALRRSSASRSVTSRQIGSQSARLPAPASRFAASTIEDSSRSTRSKASTMVASRAAHASPIPRPAPVTIPTVVIGSSPFRHARHSLTERAGRAKRSRGFGSGRESVSALCGCPAVRGEGLAGCCWVCPRWAGVGTAPRRSKSS